jgi:hypothetical protein
MSASDYTGWPGAPRGERQSGAVPMMVVLSDPPGTARHPAQPWNGQLDRLYDEAMARFDAFCFWYARPSRTPKGLREVAQRLEAYGSPAALDIAAAIRQALDEA